MGIIISHTTCVHYAAQDGRANDLVFHLERAGKQALDAIPGRLDQRTPLHIAAAGGHTACIQVLKEAGERTKGRGEGKRQHIPLGAAVSRKDNDGFTPLHLATCSVHIDAVRTLIKLGADVTAQTRQAGLYFGETRAAFDNCDALQVWDNASSLGRIHGTHALCRNPDRCRGGSQCARGLGTDSTDGGGPKESC